MSDHPKITRLSTKKIVPEQQLEDDEIEEARQLEDAAFHEALGGKKTDLFTK